jgi:hypothetical protein
MFELHLGDCLDVLPGLPTSSVDAIITDPPYPEIDRPYGRMTETAWLSLMDKVVRESKRILKPTGSAVFVLQPNFRRLGEMRLWLWEFLLRTARSWNLVQDVYWWNYTAIPGDRGGLLRPSVKHCLWFGPPNCYRDVSAVLWEPSQATIAYAAAMRFANGQIRKGPSGHRKADKIMCETAVMNGGSQPFNLLPVANQARNGHCAQTPQLLTDWWVNYICPPGGTVLDPFMGSGTTGLSAIQHGRNFIGIEQDRHYCEIAEKRLKEDEPCS